MHENEAKRIDDRIVSITQPHIRPIVRGKAGKSVEFERGGRCFASSLSNHAVERGGRCFASSLSNHAVGAKLSVSCFDEYVFLDYARWDNFNESGDLQKQIEEYKNYTGYYPDSVHVDKISRTRANRAWCKERGIRLSGSPLGRKPKNVSKEAKKQAQDDQGFRNTIEGKFGQAKRRFSLNLVMTKLTTTSESSIAITFLVVNLSKLLRQFYSLFFSFLLLTRTHELNFPGRLKKTYVTSSLKTVKLIF